MKIIVGAIVKDNDKYLMIQEAKKECYKKWSFPAGHLEEGEQLIQGALRETKEETGCDIEITNLLPIIEFYNNGETIIRITYLAKLLNEGEIIAKDEILRKEWFTSKEIKSMKKTDIRLYKNTLFLLDKVENNEIYPLEILKLSEE